jgi:hypothetical protein
LIREGYADAPITMKRMDDRSHLDDAKLLSVAS